MTYRFKRNEAIPQAIRRVFAEEIAWAVGQLSREKDRGKAIHEARKSVKKIRGLLSLVENGLGPLYKAEDQYFRDAGQRLSEFRDNSVMRQIFEDLAAKHPEIEADAVNQIRANLRRSEREAPPEKDVSAKVIQLLEQARVKAQGWSLEGLRIEMLLRSATATFRKGRRALKRAQKTEKAEDLHDFRKKVKQHWYQLRLLEGMGGRDIKKRIAELRDLETCLGDEHNLSVLAERLSADAETTRDRQRQNQFLAVLHTEEKSLRQGALELGKKLYTEKVSAFGERLAELKQPPIRKPAASEGTPLRIKSAVA